MKKPTQLILRGALFYLKSSALRNHTTHVLIQIAKILNRQTSSLSLRSRKRKPISERREELSIREFPCVCIDVNHPGFAKYLADARRKGLEFAVFRNRKNIGEKELKMGGTREIRIVPVIAGSKRAGIFQTVLGVVLIAMSSITNGATQAPGIALAAGGVIQILSPQAIGLKQSSSPENALSYAFGSAKNTTASRNPVPI